MQSFFPIFSSLSAKRVFWGGFFGQLWPWKKSVPCSSHITVPACETSVADGACPWYFMSYICPFTLRKPTAIAIVPEKLKICKCIHMEDLFSSFHQMKQIGLAFADCWTVLQTKLVQVLKPPLVFQDSQLRTVHWLLLWTTCCLNRCWVLELVDSTGTAKDGQVRHMDPMLKISSIDRTKAEVFH